jgi:sigma-E factor negative regulatory protein RseA
MKEQVSAMVDGELTDHECEDCVQRIREDRDFREETWEVYHLIGDTLRGLIAPPVVARVRAKLAQEPVVLAARFAKPSTHRAAWVALSAAASIAAVALVGWMALPLFSGSSQQWVGTKVAESQQRTAVPRAQGVDDYLLAHQRFTPSSAMSGIAPYVRTVSEENQSR